MEGDEDLLDRLLGCFAIAPTPSAAERAAVALRLSDGLAAGRARCPSSKLDASHWLTLVAGKLDPAEGLGRSLEGVHLDELFIVAGCVVKDRHCLEEFERFYGGIVSGAVARLGVDADARDEVTQEVMAGLLVSPDGEPPKLASYSGRGSLGSYLKVIATRAALRRKRRRRPESPPADSVLIERCGDTPDDPELEHVRRRYAPEFRQALEQAFGELRSEQRTLLRMYVTDGLTLTELATLHEVNASTVSRWLARIREGLLDSARSHISEALELRPSEYESLHKVMGTDLHVSVERLLAEERSEG
jgi:RNA polymerase sigma-70 factor (ECF subfamily)